jgi:hypothetical protein
MSTATLDRPTAAELLLRTFLPAELVIKRSQDLIPKYKDACEKYFATAKCIQGILRKHQRREISVREIPPARSAVASKSYSDAKQILKENLARGCTDLENDMLAARVPRMSWSDDKCCEFEYEELSIHRGVLTNLTTRSRHHHELIRSQIHKLPTPEVAKPREALTIIEAMTPELVAACRIISGVLILEGDQQSGEFRDNTLLGNVVDGITRASKASASYVGAAFERLSERALEKLVEQPKPRQVLTRDPAIVLGQFVLFGWKE